MSIKNCKAKGTNREYRTIELLEAAGYACTRAAGSLGAWDIIGIGSTDVVLVQVKSNRNAPPAEREILKEFICPPNCKKLIHIWPDFARRPIVKEL
jgi:Holliday junction resolvase